MGSETSPEAAGSFYIGLAVPQNFALSWTCLLVYVLSGTTMFNVDSSYLVTMQS